MVVNESGVGDPRAFVDEQDRAGDPPSREMKTHLRVGGQFYKRFPLRARIDLGRERHLDSIWLYDTFGKGDFVVSAGEPGKWRRLFVEPCDRFKKWKRHDARGVTTRWLRFTMTTPQATVAEVVVYEQTPAEYAAMQERRARLARAAEEARRRPLVDAGPPFGELKLVDEVRCGDPRDAHLFAESAPGDSRIETLLGRPCRVLPNQGGPKFFAYRIGRFKLLRPGQALVLSVEYPEDAPRAMFILNRGAEYARGFSIGPCLGDVLYSYTNNNVESLDLPLSRKFRAWRSLFWLHDRFPDLKQPRGAGPRPLTPEDGFWVVVAQSKAANAPLSRGAAVFRIRLFQVDDFDRLRVRLRRPPADLPRRYVFWREEMADGVIAGKKPEDRGVARDETWFDYKGRLMQFLGVDAYCKDLLEFGHNQGWRCGDNDDWFNRSKHPDRWRGQIELARRYGFAVLPYYEYAGSVGRRGVGRRKRCLPLGRDDAYTHIRWSEKFHADVTDPDVLADAERVLDATIVRYKDRVRFLGAWLRTRPSHMPVSFAPAALARFARAERLARPPTRERLRSEPALLKRYLRWWFGERKKFLTALCGHLRAAGVNDRALILFTAYAAEPGPSLPGWRLRIVTDDVGRWAAALARPEHAGRRRPPEAVSLADVVRQGLHLRAALAPPKTWGSWEWQYSVPPPDPQDYRGVEGVLFTFPFNRAYTVASPEAFDAFRGPSGLAVVRHYPLNENSMHPKLGYFVSDVERAGPYCMLAEARAMANGDPRFIGYLSSSSFNRGFPEVVRRFNAAFLALPALPSRVLRGACADSEVVARVIPTRSHGVYFAVVNTGLTAKTVELALPAAGRIEDAATGCALPSRRGRVRLRLDACELRALHAPRN